jgi:hypothetical protein
MKEVKWFIKQIGEKDLLELHGSEDEETTLLRNVAYYLPVDTALAS